MTTNVKIMVLPLSVPVVDNRIYVNTGMLLQDVLEEFNRKAPAIDSNFPGEKISLFLEKGELDETVCIKLAVDTENDELARAVLAGEIVPHLNIEEHVHHTDPRGLQYIHITKVTAIGFHERALDFAYKDRG